MKAPAHFFKFIKPDVNSHVSIPNSFRKYLKSTRKTDTAILRRGDQEWVVKIDDDWVFGEGWGDFKTENGVQDFDIVVFKHEGNMVFDTMVFDPSWCEREYSTNQVTKSVKKALKISKGEDTCINQSRKSLLKAENSSKTMVLNQNHNPSFVSTLKHHGTVKKMYLPKKFALENGLSSGEMIFKNVENEGLWTVYLRCHQGKYFYVRQGGLRKFCSAIGLEKGDSFRFELIDSGKKPVAIVSRIPKDAPTNIPHCKCTVTTYSIKRGVLNIPLPFARSNRLYKRKCEVFVMDERQKVWPMQLSGSGDHVRIYGSRDMLAANGLKEGDVFLLEIVDNGNKPLMSFHSMVINDNPEKTATEDRVKTKIKSLASSTFRKPSSSKKRKTRGDFSSNPGLSESLSATELAAQAETLHREFLPKKFALANGLSSGEMILKNVAPTNPHFRSTVTAYSIKRGVVNIPLPFARSNKLDKRKCEVFVMDERQRVWPMQLGESGDHVCISGSRDMLLANGLKEGDVFLLEIVDKGNKPLMNFHSMVINDNPEKTATEDPVKTKIKSLASSTFRKPSSSKKMNTRGDSSTNPGLSESLSTTELVAQAETLHREALENVKKEMEGWRKNAKEAEEKKAALEEAHRLELEETIKDCKTSAAICVTEARIHMAQEAKEQGFTLPGWDVAKWNKQLLRLKGERRACKKVTKR